ncbi:hypothetical protein, partial [Klebsiella pneumoniae]|uniref:hypothetical protein n=1 Tax=Klebsiella pneumoniae TaxID=573 RepID=UPI0024DECD4B
MMIDSYNCVQCVEQQEESLLHLFFIAHLAKHAGSSWALTGIPPYPCLTCSLRGVRLLSPTYS